MTTTSRQFKFSGRIASQDVLHQATVAAPGAVPDEHYAAPTTVQIRITNPGPTRMIGVPQYAPTVVGGTIGYQPGLDCNGSFMSYKLQPNNNCYAYACNIASNTFPQPGRAHGSLITASTLNGDSIRSFSEADGLLWVGNSLKDIELFAAERRSATGVSPRTGLLEGHFVALMVSPVGDTNWPGDYHWARSDDNTLFGMWSQKDGSDQVTNFDFAGHPIVDPSHANWTVNQGPTQPNKQEPNYDPLDLVVEYGFYGFMFVPDGDVTII